MAADSGKRFRLSSADHGGMRVASKVGLKTGQAVAPTLLGRRGLGMVVSLRAHGRSALTLFNHTLH